MTSVSTAPLPQTAPVPTPASFDVSHGIKNWGWLGNDVEGDCTVAAFYHIVMAKNSVYAPLLKRWAYRLGFRVPGEKFALARFHEYNLETGNPAKTGVEEQGWLDWQLKKGYIKEWKQIKPITPDDPTGANFEDRIRQAAVEYGGAMIVGPLTKQAYNNYGAGHPWNDDGPGIPTLTHSVALLRGGAHNEGVITWNSWQTMSLEFRAAHFTGVFVFKLTGEA